MTDSTQKIDPSVYYRPIGIMAVVAASLMIRKREVIGIRIHDQPRLPLKPQTPAVGPTD